MEQSGDNLATQFLIQKVAIDVQCGNSALVMEKIPSSLDCLSAHSLSKAKAFFFLLFN